MLFMARHLRNQEMSLRDIAKRLVITTGAKKGPASLARHRHAGYRTGRSRQDDCIPEKILEGQQAAAKGNHGGRPKVIDDDMLTFAQALRAKGVPVPEIAVPPEQLARLRPDRLSTTRHSG